MTRSCFGTRTNSDGIYIYITFDEPTPAIYEEIGVDAAEELFVVWISDENFLFWTRNGARAGSEIHLKQIYLLHYRARCTLRQLHGMT